MVNWLPPGLGPDKKEHGLYAKYVVFKRKLSGNTPSLEPVTDRVFVMNPRTDPSAYQALYRYAQHAHSQGYIQLARDIDEWLAEIKREKESTDG